MSITASGSDTRTDEDVRLDEPGDHDRFAHYVPKRLLAEATILGTPLRALCGKQWVPTRDGMRFPVCPDCKTKWEEKE